MRVILGNLRGRRAYDADLAGGRERIMQAISEDIYSSIQSETMRISRDHVQTVIVPRIQQVANQTAELMFETIGRVIRDSRTSNINRIRSRRALGARRIKGFTGEQLGGGLVHTMEPSGMNPYGTVMWQDLSIRWMVHKRVTQPHNVRRFFAYTDQLANFMRSSSTAAITIGKFGGIQVKMRGLGPWPKSNVKDFPTRFVLGKIEVKVFPRISAGLLPMLGSNNWMSHSGGRFEERFFDGDIEKKLVGPPDIHRPLVQPIVQYWMAFRIPGAIRRVINSLVNRYGLGD